MFKLHLLLHLQQTLQCKWVALKLASPGSRVSAQPVHQSLATMLKFPTVLLLSLTSGVHQQTLIPSSQLHATATKITTTSVTVINAALPCRTTVVTPARLFRPVSLLQALVVTLVTLTLHHTARVLCLLHLQIFWKIPLWLKLMQLVLDGAHPTMMDAQQLLDTKFPTSLTSARPTTAMASLTTISTRTTISTLQLFNPAASQTATLCSN